MSFSELAGNMLLIPISVDVRQNRQRLREKSSDRPPQPYTEFSVLEIFNRAMFGAQRGDVVQTLDLSSCVITQIQSDGTFLVHSTYWDHAHNTWFSFGKRVTPNDVKAFLGHSFDAQKAKRHVIIQPAEG